MSAAISVSGLTKYYGNKAGVLDLDFEVPAGEIFGYLGPNGAGKTTTIRLLIDLIRPTSGRAHVFGFDCRHDSVAIRRRVGYLPGELSLNEKLTGRELLRFYGRLRGMRDDKPMVELAGRLGLDLGRRIGALSSGNKQKIGLVQAFMHKPDLLILDEPTIGLDPLMQQEFFRMVDEAQAAGQTVFLSSHDLSEVERLADRVGIIRDGRLAVVEDVETLRRRALKRLQFHFGEPVPEATFTGLPGVKEVRVERSTVTLAVEGPVDAVIKAASRFEVISVHTREADLEEIFLAYFSGEAPGDTGPAVNENSGSAGRTERPHGESRHAG